MTAVIVEDDEAVAEIWTTFIERTQPESSVIILKSIRMVEEFLNHPRVIPDLIVFDGNLIDGNTSRTNLIQRATEMFQDCLAVSSTSDHNIETLHRIQGCTEVLRKPFFVNDVETILRRVSCVTSAAK